MVFFIHFTFSFKKTLYIVFPPFKTSYMHFSSPAKLSMLVRCASVAM